MENTKKNTKKVGKKRRPTIRQRRFAKNLIEGKTVRQAALQAGYAVKTAENPSQNILYNPGTQTAIEELKQEFARVGLNVSLVAQRLRESMDAKKLNNAGHEMVDWAAVHKAIDKFLNLNEIATERIEQTIHHKGLTDIFGEVIKKKENEDKRESESIPTSD